MQPYEHTNNTIPRRHALRMKAIYQMHTWATGTWGGCTAMQQCSLLILHSPRREC